MSVNKVILLGRLGQDPELKYTPSGTSVCNFSIATTESWSDKSGQKQERTEWHRIVVWGKLGELCNQYLAKGRQAFIEGTLQTRSWDDKQGQKRYTTEINAKSVQFVGGPSAERVDSQPRSNNMNNQNDNDGPNNYQASDYDIPTDTNFTADDIPF